MHMRCWHRPGKIASAFDELQADRAGGAPRGASEAIGDKKKVAACLLYSRTAAAVQCMLKGKLTCRLAPNLSHIHGHRSVYREGNITFRDMRQVHSMQRINNLHAWPSSGCM